MFCPKCKNILIDSKRCEFPECGWQASKELKKPDGAIPHFPLLCSVDGCENETAINYMFVRDSEGHVYSPIFSKVGYKKDGNHYLFDGYTFVRHITRCADCYLDMAEKLGKSPMSTLLKHHTEKMRKSNPELFILPNNEHEGNDFLTAHKKFRHGLKPFRGLPYDKTKIQKEAVYDESALIAQRPKLTREQIQNVEINPYET